MAFNPYYAFTLSPTTSAASATAPVPRNSKIGIFNVGSNEAFFKYGKDSVTATTTPNSGYNLSIPAGAYREVEIGTSDAFSAICASGSATLRCNIGLV